MKHLHNAALNGTFTRLGSSLLAVVLLVGLSIGASAEDKGLVERSKAVAGDAKEVVVDASASVANGAESAWKTIEGTGLSRHEVVAWMIVGALVGAIAGMLTSMRSTGMGRFGRLFLGLLGALIGGVAVRVGNLDLGWSPVTIRYEDILFAFAGAVLLVLLARIAKSSTQKKHA